MNAVGLVRELVAFDAWANHRMAGALVHPDAPARARELFTHVLAAHDIWWARIGGAEDGGGARPELAPSDYDAHVERVHARLDALLATESADSLERPISYRDLRGNSHATILREIVVHLVQHGTHHRAQVASLLVQAGLESPRLDFIVFARERAGGNP
jgi:uncharacterized damage-inducible protein DinB